MFRIGDFSKLAQVSVRMLRYYEKQGLLTPAKVEGSNGYRYYTAAQLEEVGKIKKLQSMGFSLTIIKEIIAKVNSEAIVPYFEERKLAIEKELAQVAAQQKLLQQFEENWENSTRKISYHVVKKILPSRKIMRIRRVLPDFTVEGELWQELYQEFLAQQVKFADPMLGVTIFHDKEYREQEVDIEIQSSIIGDYKDTEQVQFLEVAEIPVVSVTFRGSFEQMPEVMQSLAEWIEIHELQMTGQMLNISHVSPAQDPDPANWVTEACILIKE